MDTGQLRAVLSQSLGSSFAGVYPRDLIPHQLRPYKKTIVVNTDPHDRPGMHWVCLYLNTPIIEYFDSYGLPPLHHEIRDFIARHAQQWDYNRNRYQEYSTDICGQYCVYYLQQRHRGNMNALDWLFPFPKTSRLSPLQRDHYVAEMFRETYRKAKRNQGQTCQCFLQNMF